jgi:hypothetical protein
LGDQLTNRPELDQRMLDPGGVVGQPNVFPGHNGMPYRGRSPFLREDDPEHVQPREAFQVHVQIFDLSVEEDLKYYSEVWQTVANGLAFISADERQYDPDKKNWRVFLRWGIPYTYAPKGTNGQIR